MIEVHLSEYLEKHSQTDLAKSVGCAQTTISQMLRTKRPMFVITHDDGSVELIERKFGKKSA